MRRIEMKVVLYGVMSILVLVVSILIHRPSGIEGPETSLQVTETKKTSPLIRVDSVDEDKDKNRGDSGNGDRDRERPSDLPEKRKHVVKRPELEAGINETQESSSLNMFDEDEDEFLNDEIEDDMFVDGPDPFEGFFPVEEWNPYEE